MERTVPEVISEEIELYSRTYYSLLRASTEIKIRSLEEVHAGMNSLLHAKARQSPPDMSALIYSILRLPAEIHAVQLVMLAQSPDVFEHAGLGDLREWQQVSAAARRRRTFYDGKDTLVVLIASRSDIDDLIPLLTAYQIEWNKIHNLLSRMPADISIEDAVDDLAMRGRLAEVLQLELDDLERLMTIWGTDFAEILQRIATQRRSLRVQQLSGSLREYRRAIHTWWQGIENAEPEVHNRPVYFVSSNPHSLVNIVTGFALQHEEEMLAYLKNDGDALMKEEWEAIQAEDVASSRENFFYYLLKKYVGTRPGKALDLARQAQEKASGILRVKSKHSIDLEAQIIPLSRIDTSRMDPRLRLEDEHFLAESDALIINIDYPLGLAAYQILSEVAEHSSSILGIYIIGKAATLNAVVGDVMIPNVVYDGQSRNTYLFPNCFQANDVIPYLVHGSVLDTQKAVTVPGTFLQNHDYMDVFYSEGYTDIEMEAGPYLSAVYEMVRPKRHPNNEIVNLYGLPFDLGIMHYASDKPLSKGKNLGAASLSYFGMDPTYATTIAILKQIFKTEQARLKNK